MRLPALAASGLALALLGAPAHALESAYTSLDPQAGCRVLDAPEPDEPGSWVDLVCPGWGDYPVHYSEDDARVSLAYGFAPPQRPWASFAGFNRVHHTIEWRLGEVDGEQVPLATIHRWFVARQDGAGEAQVLVVSRVWRRDGTPGCPVAYIDAGATPDANVRAREVADGLAPRFRCGKEAPYLYGVSADTTPQPSF